MEQNGNDAMGSLHLCKTVIVLQCICAASFVLLRLHRLSYPSKSNRKAVNRNWSNQKANPALKTKAGNKYIIQIDKIQ